MKKVLACFLFALVSCSTPKSTVSTPITGPSLSGIGREVSSAGSHVAAADKRAEALLVTGSVPNDSRILELRADLTAAKLALISAENTIAAQQVRVDELALGYNKIVDEKNAAIFERDKTATDRDYWHGKHDAAVPLLWKWRALAIGSWVAIAAFFVARQYFPFLKLI